jgi:hypothetical protein
MRCPTGTYALGRVRIECYDGEITHPLPTCTSISIHILFIEKKKLKITIGVVHIYDVITEGEGGFQMMMIDNREGRGVWPMMTSPKIAKFLDDF